MTGYYGNKLQAVQTAVYDAPFPGYPGQIASVDDPNLIDGYPIEETNGVPAGFGVVKGTESTIPSGDFAAQSAPYTVSLPDGASVLADFVGITTRADAMPSTSDGLPFWPDESMGSVMRKGRVFALAPVAVSADDPVWMYVDDSDGHGQPIGSFTNAASTTPADTIQITTARWYKAAAANTPAIIEIGY